MFCFSAGRNKKGKSRDAKTQKNSVGVRKFYIVVFSLLRGGRGGCSTWCPGVLKCMSKHRHKLSGMHPFREFDPSTVYIRKGGKSLAWVRLQLDLSSDIGLRGAGFGRQATPTPEHARGACRVARRRSTTRRGPLRKNRCDAFCSTKLRHWKKPPCKR